VFRRVGGGMLVAMGAVFAVLCAAARAEVVDRIVAKVGDQVVLMSELQQKAAQTVAELRKRASGNVPSLDDPRLLNDLLQSMVDELLMVKRAEELALKVEQEDIDRAVDEVKSENQISSDEELDTALRREGMTLQKYRDYVSRQLLLMKVQRNELMPKIRLTDADVASFYESHRDDFAVPETIHARHILVRVPKEATPEEESALYAKAEQIKSRIASPEDFVREASAGAQGTVAVEGGDLGEITKGEMIPELEAVVFALPVGTVSQPVRSPFGYHLLMVESKVDAHTKPLAEVEGRIRSRLMQERIEAAAKGWLEDLRRTTFVEIMLDQPGGKG
jgi:peptidyl-prolyl cis-trans isomerase SurA